MISTVPPRIGSHCDLRARCRPGGACRGLAWLVLGLGLWLGAGGCESLGQRLDEANTAYVQGHHQQAYETAAPLAERPGVRGEHAAYIAGRAAEELGRPQLARGYLERAARSRDDALAADALASLGLLHLRQGRYREAAAALERAGAMLEGEQRANALFYAGIAHQRLDRWHQARTNLVLARAATSDPGLRQRIEQRLDVTGYTIQLGAFTEADNARRVAEAIGDRARALDLGDPRLVATTDAQGRALTVVQVGRFSSFETARTARTRLEATQSIILPIRD